MAKKPTVSRVLRDVKNNKTELRKKIKKITKGLNNYEVIVFADQEIIKWGSEKEQLVKITIQIVGDGVNEKLVWRESLWEYGWGLSFLDEYMEVFDEATTSLYEWVKTVVNENVVVTKGESKIHKTGKSHLEDWEVTPWQVYKARMESERE